MKRYFIYKSNESYDLILVRTVIELVRNKPHYINQCSASVGPFNEALRRTCNNNQFSELYEIVALTNVLQCEIQSVYPYINYRPEMKIMNAIYKPIETSVARNKKIIIFWTNSKDEQLTRARPNSGGVWSPNHFVPLIHAKQSNRITTTDGIIFTAQVENAKFHEKKKRYSNYTIT